MERGCCKSCRTEQYTYVIWKSRIKIVELCAQWPHIPTSSHGTQTTTEDVSEQTRNAWRVATDWGEAISHCFKWYRHWPPFCISLVAKRDISNKIKDISNLKNLFWGFYNCFPALSVQKPQSSHIHRYIPTVDFTPRQIIPSCTFEFHFLIIFKSVPEGPNFKFQFCASVHHSISQMKH